MFVHLIATKLMFNEEISYTKHLAPLFATQCAPCHQANGSAPFDFSTYDGVKASLALIRQQLQSRAMPPVRTSSNFVSHRFRPWTDEELVWFQEWDRAGAKLDNGPLAGVSIEPPFAFSQSATQGSNHTVAVEGAPYWKAVDVSKVFPKSIVGFSLTPRSPRAVRSVVLVAVPAGLKIQPDAVTNVPPAQAQVIGVWSPLFPVFALPPGVAYTLPAGFEYKLWVLYQPQGKPVSGAIQVHMHEPDKRSRLVQATRVQHPAFTIKERESKWLTVTQKIDRPSTLYSVTPLARFYCNVIKVSVKQPNGSETEIATINKHDPYWTQAIQLSSPLKLQAGATVTSKYFYANDKYCRMNEGKEPEIVKSGQKITDEACELRLLLSD